MRRVVLLIGMCVVLLTGCTGFVQRLVGASEESFDPCLPSAVISATGLIPESEVAQAEAPDRERRGCGWETTGGTGQFTIIVWYWTTTDGLAPSLSDVFDGMPLSDDTVAGRDMKVGTTRTPSTAACVAITDSTQGVVGLIWEAQTPSNSGYSPCIELERLTKILDDHLPTAL